MKGVSNDIFKGRYQIDHVLPQIIRDFVFLTGYTVTLYALNNIKLST